MARFTLPRDLYHGPNALEALKTAKPYLFGAKDAAWGMKLGGAGAEPVSRARMIAQNYYKNKYGEEKR